MVSNWILCEAGFDKAKQDRLFRQTIDRQWGTMELNSESSETFQGVNYVAARDSIAFADAWVVRNAWVCKKTVDCKFDFTSKAPCTLVFCAGPNAGARGSRTGSLSRTANKRASLPTEYDFFRQCVSTALGAAFDAMLNEGVNIVIVARISCGLYSQEHRLRINEDFVDIVNAALRENVGSAGYTRGHYFDRVILPLLPENR